MELITGVSTTLFMTLLCLLVILPVAKSQEEDILKNAQKILMESSIEFDTSNDENMQSMQFNKDLPQAYRLVLESMLEEAKTCDPLERYRRADGVCNNMINRLWGAALQCETRLLPNAYLDGLAIPRMLSTNNLYLPSSRKISTECFTPSDGKEEFLDKQTTQMSMQWGQYIDHDLVFTEVMPGKGCCSDPRHTCVHPDTFTAGPCYPIGIPDGDRYFNSSCMPFKRSFAISVKGVREQINGVTSMIDASTTYGSNQAHQDLLRTFVDGQLKVDHGNLLPVPSGFRCTSETNECPDAGDSRVSVFHGLTIIHLMFVREHNRLAKKLKAVRPDWNDEKIFQETRKIVIAYHQKITYEEFLPHVIGPHAMETFKLLPGSYQYEIGTNPNTINSFAAAAFRYGHSQITGEIPVNNHKMAISDTFFKTLTGSHAEQNMKHIMKHQCSSNAQEVGTSFSQEVSDRLFPDAKGLTTDLAARNVQRGRDHGLPPYLDFFDLTINKYPGLWNATVDSLTLPHCLIDRVYDSAKDVDLFVGGLAEKHLPGALVGPTFAYILGEQFRRVKFGDRFFYETEDPVVGFTSEQLGEIRKQSFAHIACRNTLIKHIQPDVFSMANSRNREVSCDKYKDIDLSHWKGVPDDDTKETEKEDLFGET